MAMTRIFQLQSAATGDSQHLAFFGVSRRVPLAMVGTLYLTRTGPEVPPVSFGVGAFVVTKLAMQHLSARLGTAFEFRPVVLERLIKLECPLNDSHRIPYSSIENLFFGTGGEEMPLEIAGPMFELVLERAPGLVFDRGSGRKPLRVLRFFLEESFTADDLPVFFRSQNSNHVLATEEGARLANALWRDWVAISPVELVVA